MLALGGKQTAVSVMDFYYDLLSYGRPSCLLVLMVQSDLRTCKQNVSSYTDTVIHIIKNQILNVSRFGLTPEY